MSHMSIPCSRFVLYCQGKGEEATLGQGGNAIVYRILYHGEPKACKVLRGINPLLAVFVWRPVRSIFVDFFVDACCNNNTHSFLRIQVLRLVGNRAQREKDLKNFERELVKNALNPEALSSTLAPTHSRTHTLTGDRLLSSPSQHRLRLRSSLPSHRSLCFALFDLTSLAQPTATK